MATSVNIDLKNDPNHIKQWRSLAANSDKLFQSVLVSPALRKVNAIAAGRSFKFLQATSLEEIPDLLNRIDPTRLSRTLLDRLKIPYRQDHRRKVIIDTALVKDLVQVFANIEPLDPRNSRVWLITKHPNPELQGSILIHRFLPNQKEQLQCFRTLAEARRKTSHQENSHEREVTKMQRLIATTRGVLDQTLQWKNLNREDRESLLKLSRTLSAQAAKDLNHPQLPGKIRAGKKLRAVSDLKDSTSRLNPAGSSNRLTAVIGYLGARLKSIISIRTANKADNYIISDRLEAIKFRATQAVEGFRSFRMNTLSHLAIFAPDANEKFINNQLQGLFARLGVSEDFQQSLNLRPYQIYGDLIAREKVAIHKAANNEKRDSKESTISEADLHFQKLKFLVSLLALQESADQLKESFMQFQDRKSHGYFAKLKAFAKDCQQLCSRFPDQAKEFLGEEYIGKLALNLDSFFIRTKASEAEILAVKDYLFEINPEQALVSRQVAKPK